MKSKYSWLGGAVALLIVAQAGMAAEGPRWIHFENRLRLRYDDNVTQSAEDKTSSLAVVNDLVLDVNRAFEGGYAGLRYRASMTWYDDRPGSSSDIDHFVSAQVNRTVNPRLSLALRNAFSSVAAAELIREDGTLLRRDSAYIYNTLNGSVMTLVAPRLYMDLSGRHVLLRYDDDLMAEREDYDLVAAGLTLRNQVSKDTALFGEARYESQDYKGALEVHPSIIEFPGAPGVRDQRLVPDRGSDTMSFGLGMNHLFSPHLIGTARAGYMKKDFDAANSASETAPYGEASLTVVPSPATRMVVSAVYSLYKSSLITFANQERTALAANLSHDLSGKVSVYLGASYIRSKYDADESVATIDRLVVIDGTEEAFTLSASVTYKVDRMNRIEAGVSTTDLSSDLRDGFTRNRFDVAWNLRF